MRSLLKNKQTLYYALLEDSKPIYETDGNGDIVYLDIDGKQVPKVAGETKESYGSPVKFRANIGMAGGRAEAEAFGVSLGDYDAILYESKGVLPIMETSLIWYDSEPVLLDDGSPDPRSADFRVKRVPPCLDEVVYLLERMK